MLTLEASLTGSVAVQVRNTVSPVPAVNAIWLLPAPAVMLPPEMVHAKVTPA